MRDFLKKLLPIIVLAVLASCNNTQESKDDVLWYRQAAANWNEAMPLGNGRIGVMVFGDPSKERIQLNDDSLWPNDAGWEITDGNREDLEEIRQLLKEGKNAEADKMVVNKYSRKAVTRSHQTMGDLYLELGHENISDYKRELNLSKAIANISYRSNGNLVSEKVFVSHPHRAIVIELTTEAEEGLNGKIRMSRPKDKGHETATTSVNDNGLLVMNGEITQYGGKFDSKPFPITEGVKFETCLQLDNQGGEIIKGEDYLELLNVKKATFVLVSNSSFYHQDYQNKNIEDLRTLQGIDINTIEKKHIEDFRSYYSKLELSLADGSYDSLATDVRLQRIKDGETDPGLSELLFKYGRYLLISSSRPGTNPANLQGLWNEHIKAPWNADYHLNINLQMNYWLADVTNLGELNEPLFDYVDILVESGKETANKNFGCRGRF
ncbi:MAG: glycoside hydrolase family 95 protein, partial [Bacteroidota bacterium]